GQEDCSRNAECAADDQCEDRRVERAPRFSQDPVALSVWIPHTTGDEANAIPSNGRSGRDRYLQDDESHEQDGQTCETETCRAKRSVDEPLTARRRVRNFPGARFEERARRDQGRMWGEKSHEGDRASSSRSGSESPRSLWRQQPAEAGCSPAVL